MKADQISGVFWFIFSLLSMYGSYKLKLGNTMQPSAGFFPFLCSTFILLMAIIVMIQAFVLNRGLHKKFSDIWKTVPWQRPLIIALIIGGYILILERIGFVISAFLLLLMLLKIVEKHSWKKTFMISLLTVIGCYFVFNNLLMVALPMGMFGF